MARFFTCDRTREHLTPAETTTIRVSGPLASMIDRRELHLSKPQARELARFFGFTVFDPMEQVPGPDDDATAADLAALRVGALERGTPAGSRPPKPKGRGAKSTGKPNGPRT